MRHHFLGLLLLLTLASTLPANPAIGPTPAQAGQSGTAAVSGRATAGPARIGGPAQAGAPNPATLPAEGDPQKAVEKFLKDKGAAGLTGRVSNIEDPALADLFKDWHFVALTIPQWPIARAPEKPLEMNNLFAIDDKGNVTHMTKSEDLDAFFKAKLGPTKFDAQPKAATAWATLTTTFYQDGMYKFSVGKPEVLAMGSRNTNIRIVTTVDPAGGDSGKITSTVSFDPQGAYVSGRDQSTLKAGMRPICQATKLLDPDPLVRRMAQQDILIMGEKCFWYLDMIRAQSNPDLQAAIDQIKEQARRDERITPRQE